MFILIVTWIESQKPLQVKCNDERQKLTIINLQFLSEASFGLRVLSLPSSVCVPVCVCESVNPELVRTITHHPFKLEPPNLDKRCKIAWLRSRLFLERSTLTFKVKSNSEVQICPFGLVRTITHQPFKLGSPNLDQRCKSTLLNIPIVFWGNWPWPSRSNLTSKSNFIKHSCRKYIDTT